MVPVENKDIILVFEADNVWVQFYYGYREQELITIGPYVNVSFLSDETCEEGWFTNAMIGICCQNLAGLSNYADFDWFEVRLL